MTHRRPKSPGSFQDELAELIERISPVNSKPPRRPETQDLSSAELNDRLFERAWWRPRGD